MLHTQLIESTGGRDGIRDEGLLDSALKSPFQSFSCEELYPSIQAKAARLCYGLVKNHAMIDRNKRILVLAIPDQRGRRQHTQGSTPCLGIRILTIQ